MPEKKIATPCGICGVHKKTSLTDGVEVCSTCRSVISCVKNHPDLIKKVWPAYQDEPILPYPENVSSTEPLELPDVLDGKRYRTVDRENNKWYLSISELGGNPVEVFASTAFDRNHELQSRISNLTTITRLISLILRHIFLHEPLTFDKCLKQIQRSSRQKNDLPDMLYGVLSRYNKNAVEGSRNQQVQ